MIYLLLSVLCSGLLVFMFKVFDRYNIVAYPAIVFNYITCIVCGLLNSSASPIETATASAHAEWLWLAVAMGIFFIHVFSITGVTAVKFGVTTASVAMKLGLVIPVGLAFLVYHEEVTWYKIVGIICALVAVVLSSKKEESEDAKHEKLSGLVLFLPAVVLISSGMCDSGAQLANKLYFSNGGADYFVLVIFTFAALTGLSYMAYHITKGHYKLHWNQVAGGLALGIPNYGSMLFLMKALTHIEGGSSVVFPINNIATVACSTLLSVIFFKEKLNNYNKLGLVFAFLCILLINWANLMRLLN